MRVLLALDGSASADAARLAVKTLPWPDASVIHVLAVVEPHRLASDGLAMLAPSADVIDEVAERQLADVVNAAAASLQQPSRLVHGHVAVGRAASVIVEMAAELQAELVVVGSRGRGPLSSMVLGSVSAEVVGDAPCAVLVVRESVAGPVLVATDGSVSADAAISFVVSSRLFVDRPIEVLAVASRSPVTSHEVSAMLGTAEDIDTRGWREGERAAEQVAARAAIRLRHAGHQAHSSIAVGDPAHCIIEAAAAARAGVIVTGSRGLTGLRRLILGSVARNVLLHSTASVLVVHEPLRERAAERLASAGLAHLGEPMPA